MGVGQIPGIAKPLGLFHKFTDVIQCKPKDQLGQAQYANATNDAYPSQGFAYSWAGGLANLRGRLREQIQNSNAAR